MRKLLLIAVALMCVLPLAGQTIIQATKVIDNTGNPLATGSLCFNSTCFTVTSGAITSGSTISPATYTITVVNGATTYLTIPSVTVGGAIFSWDSFVAPATAVLTGLGVPRIACYPGASYTQTDGLQSVWNCTSINGVAVWNGLASPSTLITDKLQDWDNSNRQNGYCAIWNNSAHKWAAQVCPGNGIPSGSSMPGTCILGSAFVLTGTSGAVCACTATNTWVCGGTGSGVSVNGVTLSGTANFLNNSYCTFSLSGNNVTANCGVTTGAIAAALGYTPENPANKDVAGGYPGLDSNSHIALARIPIGPGLAYGSNAVQVSFGTAGNTAAAGNDSRITGAAQKSQNLSDLSSPSTALGNLGGAPASTTATKTAVQQQAYNYAADTGTANAYAATLLPTPTLTVGMPVVFQAANANTGASTLAVNGGSAITILKHGTQALIGGEISAGQIVRVAYDGTNFQMQSEPSVATQAANTVQAGPASGSPAQPSYRPLAPADIAPAGTLSNNTSGRAGTATALANTPTPCATGYAAGGVDASGNAVNCNNVAFTPGQQFRQMRQNAKNNNAVINQPLLGPSTWAPTTAFFQGQVAQYGGQNYIQHNGGSPAPTLATVGTAGSTTYKYVVVATSSDYSSTTGLGTNYMLPSSTIAISTANATLSSSNKVQITTAATNTTSLPSCSVFRVYYVSAGSTNGSNTGYVGTATCGGSPVYDTGSLITTTTGGGGSPSYNSLGWSACWSGTTNPSGTSAAPFNEGTCQWFWIGNTINSNSPNAPAITYHTSTVSGMTLNFPVAVNSAPSSNFQLLGGVPTYKSNGNVICLAANTVPSGANCTSTRSNSDQHALFVSDAPRVQMNFYGGVGPVGVIIDNQRLVLGDLFPQAYGNIELDFTGTSGTKIRSYMVITENGESPNFVGVNVDPQYRVWSPSTTDQNRFAVLGDSLTCGGGGFPDDQAGGYWPDLTGQLMGFNDVWVLAEGGTGAMNPGSGAYNYQTRIADVCNANYDGNLHLAEIFDYINDGAYGGFTDGSCSIATGGSCSCTNGTCSCTSGSSCTGEQAYIYSLIQGMRSCYATYGTPNYNGPILMVGNWPSQTGPNAGRSMLDVDAFNAIAAYQQSLYNTTGQYDKLLWFAPVSAQGCSGTTMPCTAAGTSGWPTGPWNVPIVDSVPWVTGVGNNLSPATGYSPCTTFPVSGNCDGSTDVYLNGVDIVHPTNLGIKYIAYRMAKLLDALIGMMP